MWPKIESWSLFAFGWQVKADLQIAQSTHLVKALRMVDSVCLIHFRLYPARKNQFCSLIGTQRAAKPMFPRNRNCISTQVVTSLNLLFYKRLENLHFAPNLRLVRKLISSYSFKS